MLDRLVPADRAVEDDALPGVLRGAPQRGLAQSDRLGGDAIPLGSRILFVADAYDAMTTDRVYRSKLSHERAISELERCAGTQFDPVVVSAFKEEFDEPRLPELVVLETA